MKRGILGALVGFILGLTIGTALFGPLGGAVGAIFGLVSGFFIVTPLVVVSVSEAAKKPFLVKCPETHEEVQVTLNPKRAAHAELWNRRQRIETCSRFNGPPNCDEGCVGQLDI
jgi:hypothetical protein